MIFLQFEIHCIIIGWLDPHLWAKKKKKTTKKTKKMKMKNRIMGNSDIEDEKDDDEKE